MTAKIKNKFKNMVTSLREVEKALGSVNYSLSEKVKKSLKFGRSLSIVKDIKKVEKFTVENVRSIRPGYGMEPKYYNEVLGKKVNSDFEEGTP